MLMVNQLTGFGVGAGGTDPDWAFVEILAQPTAEDVTYPVAARGGGFTYGGGPYLTGSSPIPGGSGISFDGIDDYGDLPGVALSAGTPYAVEAIITRLATGNAANILCKWGTNMGYQFYVSSGGGITAYLNTTQPFVGTEPITVGVATHLAWANDATTLRAYVGGALDKSAATPTITNNAGFNSRLGLDNQGSIAAGVIIHALRVTVGSHRGYTGASIPVPTALWPTS